VFGGPERLQIMPDCGLRTRSWDVAYRKLIKMVAGVELARAAFGVWALSRGRSHPIDDRTSERFNG
jgi:Cobalamin-independent synthase, Catalytic domain